TRSRESVARDADPRGANPRRVDSMVVVIQGEPAMKKLLLAAGVCVISWTPADAADRLSGTWTTGGTAPQTFVFKAGGAAFGGVVCGPCDDPASVFRVENGRFVDADHLTFSVAYDRGAARDRGPQLMTGTLSGNQLTLETRADGRQASRVTTHLKRVVE